jgi:hypothetical protein
VRLTIALVLAGLGTASCDSGNGPGGAPSPTPSATVAPTPTPTPSISYARYAELTGDQQFKTSCAGIRFEGSPRAQPASRFGDGISLSYAATADTYTVAGVYTFGPSDVVPSTPPVERSYVRGTTLLNITQPVANGTGFEYARGDFVTFLSSAWMNHFWCALGVPMAQEDRLPGVVFAYSATTVSGEGITRPFSNDSYDLAASVASMYVNPFAGTVFVQLDLRGVPRAGGAAVLLGTFQATATIDATKPSIDGSFTSSDRLIEQSSLGGWFFGPRGKEIGMAFQITATDPATGQARVYAGTMFGIR